MIKVLAHHLKNGMPRSSTGCMVALAVSEVYPDKLVYVGKGTVRIMTRQTGVPTSLRVPSDMYFLPDRVIEAIRKFDEDKYVDPFEFELGAKFEEVRR